MTLQPISLGVTREFSGKRASPPFSAGVDEAEFRARIFERDKNTCRFCGFGAKKYQQIYFANGNRRDLRFKNATTSCIFCEQCFALEKVARMRSGNLIWLPELSQPALHHLCRAIYVARISTGVMADAARKALDTLMLRKEEAKQRIGTDDPAILSAALQDYLEDRDYHNSHAKLNGIRLLPLDRRVVKDADMEFNQFPQILAFWRSKEGPFGGALPPGWADAFQSLTGLKD